MTSLADSACVVQPRSVLSEGQLASLARTYDGASSPVWVYDRSARCVYRNRSAKCLRCHPASRLRFEIVDHGGGVVGHLATVQG